MADEVDMSGNAPGGLDRWESEIRRRARLFAYPPTPDFAGRIQVPVERRMPAAARPAWRAGWAWAVVLALVLFAAVLAVAPVRAWVAEILQLGAVRIFVQPTLPSATEGTPSPPPTAVPRPTPLSSVLDMSGATTLAEAETQLPFPVQLPAYPPDWGLPDHVYVQNLDGPALVLVWMDRQQPEKVMASLHLLTSEAMVYKMQPQQVDATTVDGVEALWLAGPYIVQNGAGEWAPQRLVAGHVLIWTDGELTYRLESDLTVEEAVRVAESLAPRTTEVQP